MKPWGKRCVILKVLSNLLIFKTVLGNEERKLLNTLVNIITSSAFNKIMGFSPTASLSFLALLAGAHPINLGWERGVLSAENIRDLAMAGGAWSGRRHRGLDIRRTCVPSSR